MTTADSAAREAGALLPRAVLREAADSVYRRLERTAEAVPDGVRWQTVGYHGEPEYDVRLYNGVAGIALFLADYSAVTGETRARVLAEGALAWCAAPARARLGEDTPMRGPGMRQSLLVGRTGLGLAWLHLAAATGQEEHLAAARAIGDGVLAHGPGPFNLLLSGAAGEGHYLLRLLDATGDARYLEGAERWGDWLARQAVRDEHGLLWPARDPLAVAPEGTRFAGGEPPARYLGFGVGAAGIGFFLARLHAATSRPAWGTLAREAADTLQRLARPAGEGLQWPGEPLGEPPRTTYCQWCRGAPGVGLFFCAAGRALAERAYRRTAERAGLATYACGDMRKNPSVCHGLAGNAQLFLQLHLLTGHPDWLARAHEFARQALAYRTGGADGDIWAADEPGSTSPDLMCGAAGVGHFFLQLLEPVLVRFPLF